MNEHKHRSGDYCSRGLRPRRVLVAGLTEASYSACGHGLGAAGYRTSSRHGSLLLELIASLGVLTTVIAVATPLTVRHGRILTAAREYRIAVEELSNQMERLTALPSDQQRPAIAELVVSDFAAKRLPGAELTAELTPVDVGDRLALNIVWDEPQRREAPVRLVAWIAPESSAEQSAEIEEEAP